MFTTSNPNTLAVTHGRFSGLTVDRGADGKFSASLNYEEGYMNGETFVPLGVNHILAQDKDAYTDEEGNIVIAETGYTSFLQHVGAYGMNWEQVEGFIKTRI